MARGRKRPPDSDRDHIFLSKLKLTDLNAFFCVSGSGHFVAYSQTWNTHLGRSFQCRTVDLVVYQQSFAQHRTSQSKSNCHRKVHPTYLKGLFMNNIHNQMFEWALIIGSGCISSSINLYRSRREVIINKYVLNEHLNTKLHYRGLRWVHHHWVNMPPII